VGWWSAFLLGALLLVASGLFAIAASQPTEGIARLTCRPLSRREMLAATLSGLLLPGLAQAQTTAPDNQEPTDMRVHFHFNAFELTATLYDNPSARDFVSMLPLALEITDFSSNEKIAYLPRTLSEEGAGPFGNEQPYGLCYYAPWGNARCSMRPTNIRASSGLAGSTPAPRPCVSRARSPSPSTSSDLKGSVVPAEWKGLGAVFGPKRFQDDLPRLFQF